MFFCVNQTGVWNVVFPFAFIQVQWDESIESTLLRDLWKSIEVILNYKKKKDEESPRIFKDD